MNDYPQEYVVVRSSRYRWGFWSFSLLFWSIGAFVLLFEAEGEINFWLGILSLVFLLMSFFVVIKDWKKTTLATLNDEGLMMHLGNHFYPWSQLSAIRCIHGNVFLRFDGKDVNLPTAVLREKQAELIELVVHYSKSDFAELK